jgi:hypothetical protein
VSLDLKAMRADWSVKLVEDWTNRKIHDCTNIKPKSRRMEGLFISNTMIVHEREREREREREGGGGCIV